MLYSEQMVGQTFQEGGGLISKLFRFNGAVANFSYAPDSPSEPTLVKDCIVKMSGLRMGMLLKFAQNIIFKKCVISGGVDCAVKIARSNNIVFESCLFISRGSKTHVSICAGSGNIVFKNCTFEGDLGRGFLKYCVTLGDWDNSNIIDRPCVYGVGFESCRIISKNSNGICKFFYSEPPTLKRTEAKVLGIPRWIVNLIWKMKRKKLKDRVTNKFDKKIFSMEVPS
jgi:hypothetical protein